MLVSGIFLALWWPLVSGRQTPYSYIFSYHALATNSSPIMLSPCLANPLRLNNRNNAFLLLPSIRGYAQLAALLVQSISPALKFSHPTASFHSFAKEL